MFPDLHLLLYFFTIYLQVNKIKVILSLNQNLTEYIQLYFLPFKSDMKKTPLMTVFEKLINHLIFNIDMVKKTWDIIPYTSPKKKIHIGCMNNRVELFLSFCL